MTPAVPLLGRAEPRLADTLPDLLDASIVRAMMAADAVEADAIRILFARVRFRPTPPKPLAAG